MFKILQISYERLTMLSRQFLDALTSEQYKFGKNHEKYWLINANTALESIDFEQGFMNHFLSMCKIKGYNSLMILK